MNDLQPRTHVSFPTQDLEAAQRFYEALFGVEPVKVRADYVKFSVRRPVLNFSLTKTSAPVNIERSHFGIEVRDAAELSAWRARIEQTGLEPGKVQEADCCYANQSKFWVEDPDGRPWEVFVVHDDTEQFGARTRSGSNATTPSTCCASDCCAEDAAPAKAERSCCDTECCT